MSQPYYTLLASLPHLPMPYSVRRPPISRLQLERRLAFLSEEHQALLGRIEAVIGVDGADNTPTYLVFARSVVAELPPGDVRDYLAWYLELRTLISALRLRNAEREPGEDWGETPHLDHIRRNWSQPLFKLEALFPWLHDLAEDLGANRMPRVERRLIELQLERLDAAVNGHHFDFAAVVFYVLKHRLIDGWTRLDRDAARDAFSDIAEEIFHEHHISLD